MKPMCRQSGAVLIAALVLLLIMTLLGLASMQNTSLEERMAGNVRHANIAFQAAESGLREAEGWLLSRTSQPTASSSGSGGVWILDSPLSLASSADASKPWWEQAIIDWSDADVTVYTDTLQTTDSLTLTGDARPRYVVEERAFVRDSKSDSPGIPTGRMFYQVTARGTDVSGRMEVKLQSTFTRRY